ncbi:MAG: 50S ribosomal protein L9 [Candidatus Omnitrophica bacterium]|nr:50S ribosomal protein L9 [Candidatus Omnitrophota bacterium]
MKVILLRPFQKLGEEGEVVEVKGGYARNYLIPRGIVMHATKDSYKKIEELKERRRKQEAQERGRAEELKQKLKALSVTIACEVKNEEEIFGSVAEPQIRQALQDEEIDLQGAKIEMAEPIRKLGAYNLTVHLTAGIDAAIRVWVVKK